MRHLIGLIYGKKTSTCDIIEFKAQIRPATIFMQDTVHIGTKLKAKLLKKSIILALGYNANLSHLPNMVLLSKTFILSIR